MSITMWIFLYSKHQGYFPQFKAAEKQQKKI